MEELFTNLFKKVIEPLAIEIIDLKKTVEKLTVSKSIMNVEEVAEYLGMSRAWVDKNIDSIPSFKLGSRPKFNREDIDKWRLSQSSTMKDRFTGTKIKIAK